MSTVEYRSIVGCPDYRVGSDGSVWSCRIKGNSKGRTGGWKRLSLYRRPYGARYVVVCMRPEPNGKVRCFYIHRLVLEAFVGPCPDGMGACHNDGNTANNCLDNLRWDTQVNNMEDKKRHGTHLCGERAPSAKLTAEQVTAIRLARLKGADPGQLAAAHGVSRLYVNCLLRRDSWGHVDDKKALCGVLLVPRQSSHPSAYVYHAVSADAQDGWSLCGYKPSGSSRWVDSLGDEVTCRRCLANIQKSGVANGDGAI